MFNNCHLAIFMTPCFMFADVLQRAGKGASAA